MTTNPTGDFGEPSRRKAEDFLALILQQKQGKTFQMLTEGNRLKKRGVDVVIGYVEPHARPETTAQIGELEIVPPVITQYQGVALREMATAAVVASAPTVAQV